LHGILGCSFQLSIVCQWVLLAQLHAKFDSFGSQLAKIDTLEKSISTLIAENVAFHEEIREKDKIIEQLSEKVNKLDQSLCSNSIRIHGLSITSSTPASGVPGIVYKEIIMPIMDTAKQNGDNPPSYTPNIHFTLVNVFALPSKKSSTAPVVVKFYSEFIRNLVLKHKRATILTAPNPTSNCFHPIYSIYEYLTASNHSLLHSFADDSRVKSVWSFSSQIRFKTHQNETVYRATSLSDTFNKLVKPPASNKTPPPSLLANT
jgi:hypothetical protein